MAAYTPPPSPGGLRSPRDRALEIGTVRTGFMGGEAPDITMPKAQEIGPQLSYQGGAINPSTPFTITK